MDLLEKCKLISNNILINNRGYGHVNEIDLEILKELRDEITRKLEQIVNPIIEEYKKRQKAIILDGYGIKDKNIDPYDNGILLEKVNEIRRKLGEYFSVLQDIDKRIEEFEPKVVVLPVIK